MNKTEKTDQILDLIQELINSEEILINYHDSPYELKQIAKGGCVDLYNQNELNLKQGEMGFIDFGVSMELPQGYDALIFPRSSTFKKWGILLTNSVGYIDNSYRSNDDRWLACVYATKDIQIPIGTRCFQFRLIKEQPQLIFTPVDNLEGETRGSFGSTGD